MDIEQRIKPKFKIGDLVGTAEEVKVFSRGKTTNRSDKLDTNTEDSISTITTYLINIFPEKFKEAMLLKFEFSLKMKQHSVYVKVLY